MAFRLKSVSCSAQGAWNIYILQPEWLDRKGVFAPDRPVHVETLTTGPGFRYTAGKKSLQWTVTPFQVTVSGGPDQGAEAGAALAALLAALPETPLRDAGFQLEFRGTEGTKDQGGVPDLTSGSPESGEPALRRGVSVVVARGAARYFLELVRGGDGPGLTLDVTTFIPAGPAGVSAEFLQDFGAQIEAVRDIAAGHLAVTLA